VYPGKDFAQAFKQSIDVHDRWDRGGSQEGSPLLLVHGPEMIQLADRILLLDRGLLASGTYEMLLVPSVLYRKLLAEMDHTSLEVHKVD